MRHVLLLAAVLVAGCASVARDRGAAAINERLAARGAPPATFESQRQPRADRRSTECGPGGGARVRTRTRSARALRRARHQRRGCGRGTPAAESHARVTRASPVTARRGSRAARRSASPTCCCCRAARGSPRMSLEITRDRVGGAAAAARKRRARRLVRERGRLAVRRSRGAARRARPSLCRIRAAPRRGGQPAAANAGAGARRRGRGPGRRRPARVPTRCAPAPASRRSSVYLPATTGTSPRDCRRCPRSRVARIATWSRRRCASRLDVAAARRDAQALDGALDDGAPVALARRLRSRIRTRDGNRRRDAARPDVRVRVAAVRIQPRRACCARESARDAARARSRRSSSPCATSAALAMDRMATARDIAEVYRTALVPQREAASARTLEVESISCCPAPSSCCDAARAIRGIPRIRRCRARLLVGARRPRARARGAFRHRG